MRRFIVFAALALSPCLGWADSSRFDGEHPHWFGLGAGISTADTGRPPAVFSAGRLWAEEFGVGCLFLYGLGAAEPDQSRFTALGSIDYFTLGRRMRLAWAAGVSPFSEKGASPERYFFTTGARLGYSFAVAPYWFLEMSVNPIWIPVSPEDFKIIFLGEFQLRY